MPTLGDIRLVVATEDTIEDAGIVIFAKCHCVHAIFQGVVGIREELKRVDRLVRTTGDVVFGPVGVLDRQTSRLFKSSIDTEFILRNVSLYIFAHLSPKSFGRLTFSTTAGGLIWIRFVRRSKFLP